MMGGSYRCHTASYVTTASCQWCSSLDCQYDGQRPVNPILVLITSLKKCFYWENTLGFFVFNVMMALSPIDAGHTGPESRLLRK